MGAGDCDREAHEVRVRQGTGVEVRERKGRGQTLVQVALSAVMPLPGP